MEILLSQIEILINANKIGSSKICVVINFLIKKINHHADLRRTKKNHDVLLAILQHSKIVSSSPLPQLQEAAQKTKDLLKQMKVLPNLDKSAFFKKVQLKAASFDNLMKLSKEASSTLMHPRDLELLCCSTELPTEIYSLILAKVKSFELKLASVELLERFSGGFSHQERFELALQGGEELTELDLSYFRELDDKKLETLQKTCPNLRSLRLSNTPIKRLNLSIFSKLENLDLSFTDIDKLDLPKSLKGLRLDNCKQLTAEEFRKLNDSFLKLERLQASDTRIATLGMLPRSLKELELNYCENIKKEEFEELNASFLKLEVLEAAGTTIATLDMLPKNSLKLLKLFSCENLTAEKIKALIYFDKLEIIGLPRKFKNEEVVFTLQTLKKKVI